MKPRIWVFVAALAAVITLSGQTPSGTIQGTVSDSSQGVIPDAMVRIQNVATNEVRELRTDAAGRFVQPFLLPGTYVVSAEKEGFRSARRENITLHVAQNISVDLTLEVGTLTQAVQIEAAPPPVETNTSSMGQVIENKRIMDLPLNGRSAFSLANLVPGVNPTGEGSTPIIGGGRNATSELQIDGVTDIGPENNVGNTQRIYEPQVDAVQEFNVIVNALAAEYGRSGGGVINVATRSGTNELHGTAYDYLRNSILDANSFFSNRAGVPRGSFKRNQWGGTIGGPIIRDKSFFFFGFEGTNQRTRSSRTTTVPIAPWREGDFSGLRYTNGQPIIIFDPTTVHQDPARPGSYIRLPFPGNRIPADRIDPVAKKLISYYPEPNTTPINPYLHTNNFYKVGTSVSDAYRTDTRVDHNWSDKWRMFARVSVAWDSRAGANHFGTIANSGGPAGGSAKQVSLDHTYTWSPTLLFNARYGFGRNNWYNETWGAGFRPSELGFPEYLDDAAARNSLEFPQISVSNFSSLGPSAWTTADSWSNVHSATLTVTKVMSSHTIKAGFEYRKFLLNYKQFGQPSGSFSFGSNWTQRETTTTSTTEGFGLASMLLGLGDGTISHDPILATESSYYGAYIQDDWRVTRKLTLNIGLRYDLDRPRTERYNQLSYFVLNERSPIAGLVPPSEHCWACSDLWGAMNFADEKNRRQTPTDMNNFGPRFGFAYSISPNTVMRGAYGILFAPSVMQASGATGNTGTEGFQSGTAMQTTLDNMRTILTYLRDPFPNGFRFPPGRSQGAATNLGFAGGSSVFEGGWRNGYVQQWNFNLQRYLPGDFVVETGYMGSRGIGLVDGDGGQLYDQVHPVFLSLGSRLLTQVPNPFYGIITDPTSALRTPTVQLRQLLRPYPQYTGLEAYRKAIASSEYHALTIRADKRFSKGLGFLLAYTASKLMDDASATVRFLGPMANTRLDAYNRRLEWSVSSLDIAQRAVISATYELPFGKGKPWLPDLPSIAGILVSGWQVNGIATFQSGPPIIIAARTNNTYLYTRSQRANNNGRSAKITGGTKDSRMMQWFDTSVFSQPENYTFGNVGRTLPDVRAPGTRNTDFSLFKNTYFGPDGRFNLQYRLEAFNAFNTTQFSGPGTTVDNPSFGVVSGTAQSPRQLQMALKLIW